MKTSSIRMTGVALLAMMLVSFAGGGAAFAGGRSSRVENALEAADTNKDIMPVAPFSDSGASNKNSLLSDADALSRNVSELSNDAMMASEGIVYGTKTTGLTLHEPGKGGPTSGGVPVKREGQLAAIDYVDQGSIDRAKATPGAPLTWSPDGGKTVYRYDTLTIDGKRYILAGFGAPEGATQSMEVIHGALQRAVAGDTILVKGGRYGNDDTTSHFEFKYGATNIKLCGSFREDGTRDIKNYATILNGYVGMTDTSNSTLDGFTIRSTYMNTSLYVDRSYNLTISNNTIINAYSKSTGHYTNTIYRWYENANAIKFHNNNKGGSILLQNNTIVSSEFAFWNHGGGNTTGVIFKDNIVTAAKNYNNIVGGNLNTQNRDTGGPKGVAPAKEKRETPAAEPSGKNMPAPLTALDERHLRSTKLFDPQTGKTYDAGKIIAIFRKMINEKDALAKGAAGAPKPDALQKVASMPMEGAKSALAAPADNAGGQYSGRGLDIALLLADMTLNPTKAQESILSAVESVRDEVAAARDRDMPGDEDLKRAADKFIDITAMVMVAQAAILKQEDIAFIEETFSEFNRLKTEITDKYESGSREYYEELRHLIVKNSDALETNGLLAKKLLENGLSNLSRQDMCSIIKKINSVKESSDELQRIIREDTGLRARHGMDKKDAEFVKGMTGLLNNFTKKFYNLLNDGGILKSKESALVKEKGTGMKEVFILNKARS